MADDRPEIDWAAIRLAYEASPEAVAEIAGRFGVHRVTIQNRAATDGWLGRQPKTVRRRPQYREPPDTASLVGSLKRTTARLVAAMEARLGSAGEGIAEGDVRALGALAATLGKVIALNPERRPERDGDPGGGHLDLDDPAVLDALSERLERLAAERSAGGSGGADPGGAAAAGDAVAAVRAGRPAAPGG